MKKIIHNNDNLREEDINEEVVRTKVLLIKDNKILIANENNVFHFPGGHQEENETLEECLIREVKEETGIVLEHSEVTVPFMKVEFLNRDYPTKGINRKNSIYYYAIGTNKDIDLSKTKYTDSEKSNNFKIEKFDLEDAVNIIKDNIKNNPKNEVIAPDMIEAINEYLYGDKEELDIYDIDGNPTGKTFKRGVPVTTFNEGEYVGLAVIFIENSKGEFLIQKASKEKNNKTSSTGGHMDRGELPIDTIIRETKEEIGLDVDIDELVFLGKVTFNNRLVFVYYLKKDVNINDLVLQKDEVDKVIYMSKEELENRIDNEKFSYTHGYVYNKLLRG